MNTMAVLQHNSYLALLLSLIFLLTFAKKDSWLDMLSTELKRLKDSGYECTDKNLDKSNILTSYLQGHNAEETLACVLRYVEDETKDSLMWSVLGTMFDQKGEEFTAQAAACFKQATMLSGKYPPFIKEWHFIGPFVIGKTEFDGDPAQAFGGIENVSRTRYDGLASFPSELVPNGKVMWQTVVQPEKDETMKFIPQVNWNELVGSIGSMGLTEWQGWLVGEFPVNKEQLTIMINCSGVSTVFIDGIPYAADVYRRETFVERIHLRRGVHTVTVRLRAKVEAVFKCSFKPPPDSELILMTPPIVPDLYDGYMFSQHFTVPVVNLRSDKWLTISKLYIPHQFTPGREPGAVSLVIENEDTHIAPGQTMLVNAILVTSDERILDDCSKNSGIPFTISINTSETEDRGIVGSLLRCSEKGHSFAFTFLDHDGSIQQAAVIEPRGSCPLGKCPVLLTLHGTTVKPGDQADSYKRMVDSKFQFGVEGMWVVAPTRHGAHNWEGLGALTAMHAVESLAKLVKVHKYIKYKVDPERILFEGHSMGGHGAWHLATHFPDKAMGVAALAGWIKKEEYGDSNLFFRHDIATSHTDASVKAVMEACIEENEVDRHVSNLWNIPILCRVGSKDRTVHPYFTRRMYRLLKEAHAKVTFTELEGREHWWWDTWETNDGGVMNDKQMRAFAADCLDRLYSDKKQRECKEEGSCSKQEEEEEDDAECPAEKAAEEIQAEEMQKDVTEETEDAELVTINPAVGRGLRGVRILQQITPFRTSRIKIKVTNDSAILNTINVLRFKINEPRNRRVYWMHKNLMVDGFDNFNKKQAEAVLKLEASHFCMKNSKWAVCHDDLYTAGQRGPDNYGPARRVAEKPFVIVVGTKGPRAVTKLLQTFAVYIANLFYLTSSAVAPIVNDTTATKGKRGNYSFIVLGSPADNYLTDSFLSQTPIKFKGSELRLGSCLFTDSRMGVLALAPHGPRGLALLLMGNNLQGLQDVVSLATPTIPPMARSPFSNLLPDFVITGDRFRRHGPGGFLCAGFWGNKWELRQDTVSCACGGP